MPWSTGDVDRHKRGLTAAQKRQWVQIANSVRAKCIKDGGSESSCDAAAIRQANGVVGHSMSQYAQTNSDYTIRFEQHQGKNHLVVPVIMMVEGVHNGSHGPLLHLAEDLGRYPGAWNGMPVTIDHPEEEGQNVSANSPELIDNGVVGRVYNTRMEDGKLKAEAWLDEEKLQELSVVAYEYIKQGHPLEVSVGVFTDEETATGDWNGEKYESIARNHRPDHLALLPEGEGACSWADGCGIRTNEKEGGNMNNELTKVLKTLAKEGLAAVPLNNELGYKSLVNSIASKLDGMDDGSKLHFLQEVYEDHFIYEVRTREGGSTLYKRGYSVNEGDESVDFADNPEEVRRKVEYTTMSATIKRTKITNKSKKEVVMSEKKDAPCCEKLVDELIANERTKFTDDDKEWLLTLKEDQVNKLVPEPEKEKDEKPADPPKVNKEQALEVLKADKLTEDEFFSFAPDTLEEQLRNGLKLQKAHREKLTKVILDNTEKGTWSEDKLKEMDLDTLESVFNSVKTEENTDFSLNDNNKRQEGDEELLYPPIVENEAESKEKKGE